MTLLPSAVACPGAACSSKPRSEPPVWLGGPDVDDQAGELQTPGTDLGLRGALTAQLGVDASRQLADLERLADVVVGADLQPDHDVDRVRARRHHDDRHLDAGGAQAAADVEP